MMNHPFEGLQLAGQVPRSINDVEGSVITEMSCLGADLLYVYAPPCDESGKAARPANDSLVMFWDFPGISRTFFHRSEALAMFLPVRWLLREGPPGVWVYTTIPVAWSKDPGDRAINPVLHKLAANVQSVFDRVCGESVPTIPSCARD
jgi:hypothetical protein